MSFGYLLGRLNSGSTGMSYIDQFDFTAGTTDTRYFSSPAFKYATRIVAVVVPAADIPATTVPSFPSVNSAIYPVSEYGFVQISGGNTNMRVLVFVG